MRKIKASAHVPQYGTTADFFIADESDGRTGLHLVAKYRDKPAGGNEEFEAGIPSSWTEEEVEALINANVFFRYPLWEIAARGFGDPSLDRIRPLLDAMKEIRAHK